VLEENAIVFFMDADGVLDCIGGTSTIDEMGVHVVNASFAITT